MYSAKVDRDGHTVRVYDERGGVLFTRSVPGRIVQVNISGNLLSVVDDRGTLRAYELPRGQLKYQR
ncbi:hypothetical protein Rhom172_1386 [Rhodothermus marinus SG0.5JP17-172]|uniref:hypothetical protein n=1 Tax=Rhodothermus marinus TaxID=29549 RepID=UPI000223D752|nr:hypothetical protein [Rhodothermus marinus]AEN73312.1 hypothetical protein Rhom172_1386 [Rhodothermus marinus SG0.5JP17-172]MBO2491399.1 hypothetical protein [Rhodothermus marinus]